MKLFERALTPDTNRGYIYIVKSGDFIKIGFCQKNVQERFRHIKTDTPMKPEIIQVFEGTIQEEKALHKKFAKFKSSGEWFSICDELTEVFSINKYSLKNPAIKSSPEIGDFVKVISGEYEGLVGMYDEDEEGEMLLMNINRSDLPSIVGVESKRVVAL